MTSQITTLLREIKAIATDTFHRRMVVFAGEPQWCDARAQDAADLFPQSRCLWVTKRNSPAAQTFAPPRLQQFLGMEFEAVIFDVYSGFDPDLFAAIAGTIKGGGLLVLLCPPLDQWESFDDPEKSRLAVWPYTGAQISGRFLRLISRPFKQDQNVVIVQQDQQIQRRPAADIPPEHLQTTEERSLEPCRSEDQQRAVQGIEHVESGHRHRPLVLTSDRGRGKSAALGIAAAKLLKQGVNKIIVTAPRLDAVTPVFQCAQNLLPDAQRVKDTLEFGQAKLMFVAADELVRRHYECQLLMVDEAAAIPAPLLEHYLKHYARVVFSTTVHGYEGTGRSFVLRFHDTLDQFTPGWRSLQLDTPIRWAKHDPLEALVFKALLLDAEPATDETADSANTGNCTFEKLDRDSLVENVDNLNQLFALLVLAHYQTQPADLRYLLDARDVHIYILRHENSIIAAALLEEEGPFDSELAAMLYANQRRVRGHLLAQSLAAYVGLPDAPLLKYVRVMRIAVHPLAQRKGLGGLLLREIGASLTQAGFDLWGASFGAAADLVRFWKKTGFSPVHLGISRNAASGMPAALVLKPITDRGDELLARAEKKFTRHFPYMLSDVYRDLDPPLVKELITSGRDEVIRTIATGDWQDIASFVNLARGYEVNSVSIWKLVCAGLRNNACVAGLSNTEYALLVAKVLQKKPWPEVVSSLGFNGQKHALSCLREAVKKLFNCRALKGNVE